MSFWQLSCKSPLHILEINPLSDTRFGSIFSHSIDFFNDNFLLFLCLEKYHWDFDRDSRDSVDHYRSLSIHSMEILTLLRLPVHEHKISFHLFVLSLMSFIKCHIIFSVLVFTCLSLYISSGSHQQVIWMWMKYMYIWGIIF